MQEKVHPPQQVDGVQVQVVENLANDRPLYDVYTADEIGNLDNLITEGESFDHYPTDDELRELLNRPKERRDYVVVMTSMVIEADSEQDAIAHAGDHGGNEWQAYPADEFGLYTKAELASALATLTDDEVRAFAAALDDDSRTKLREALLDADGAANDAAILAAIKRVLEEQAPGRDAVAVVFHTMEFDNGYFLTDDGRVFFADGTTEDYYFGIDEQLAAEYGAHGEKAALGVDLRTGEMDFDDYGEQVYNRFHVKES